MTTSEKWSRVLRVSLIMVTILLMLAGCGDIEPIDIRPFCLGGHANILLGVAIVAAILRRAGVL